MPFRAPVWQRPLFVPGGGAAVVRFFVFSATKLALEGPGPTEHTDLCPYDVWLDGVAIEARPRAWNPAFFAGFAEHARAVAAVDGLPGEVLDLLDRAMWCTSVDCQADDPPDLGYLQFCWATVRCLADEGGFLAFDQVGMRMWPAARLRAGKWPAQPLELEREVRVHIDEGELVTTGLAKFGRPELSAPVTGAWVEEAVTRTAHELALGRRYQSGDRIAFGGSRLEVTQAGEGLRLTPSE